MVGSSVQELVIALARQFFEQVNVVRLDALDFEPNLGGLASS